MSAAPAVEELDELGEVGEGAGEPVDLVEHGDVDAPGPHLGEELLESGSVE